MFLMKERGSTKEYDASLTKIREQLNRDPDTAQGPLKLSEVPALVWGTRRVTRETKDGAGLLGLSVGRQWPGGVPPADREERADRGG